jgi:hypothetical protein
VAGWEAAMEGRWSAWRRGSRRLGLVVEAAGVVAGMKKKGGGRVGGGGGGRRSLVGRWCAVSSHAYASSGSHIENPGFAIPMSN